LSRVLMLTLALQYGVEQRTGLPLSKPGSHHHRTAFLNEPAGQPVQIHLRPTNDRPDGRADETDLHLALPGREERYAETATVTHDRRAGCDLGIGAGGRDRPVAVTAGQEQPLLEQGGEADAAAEAAVVGAEVDANALTQ